MNQESTLRESNLREPPSLATVRSNRWEQDGFLEMDVSCTVTDTHPSARVQFLGICTEDVQTRCWHVSPSTKEMNE